MNRLKAGAQTIDRLLKTAFTAEIYLNTFEHVFMLKVMVTKCEPRVSWGGGAFLKGGHQPYTFAKNFQKRLKIEKYSP